MNAKRIRSGSPSMSASRLTPEGHQELRNASWKPSPNATGRGVVAVFKDQVFPGQGTRQATGLSTSCCRGFAGAGDLVGLEC